MGGRIVCEDVSNGHVRVCQSVGVYVYVYVSMCIWLVVVVVVVGGGGGGVGGGDCVVDCSGTFDIWFDAADDVSV